jgi:hypothetical protein
MISAPAASPIRISEFASAGFREADLVALWEGQRFPKEALRTCEGRRFRVIYRGRRTGGPGPDFRDAVIATREGLLRGDVELHVRASDFQRHGHQRDPAYDSVVLHLVFRHDEDSDTQLSCGRRVPVVALGDWARGRAAEIDDWLRQPALWREPCHTATERLGGKGAGAALDRLGDMRFRARSAAAAKALREGAAADGLAWAAVVEALGYGGQRALMAAVADGVPWESLREVLARRPAAERRVRALALLMAALDACSLRVPLVLRPLRPGNRPESRLKAAAVLAARFTTRGILASLAPLIAEAAGGRASRLIDAVTVPGLVGRPRAVELLTNAVLPVIAAAGEDSLAEAAYGALPLPARYGAVKHIHAALGGEVPLNARRQQGMLYLLKQYCTQGGCGKCPLS